MIPTLRSRSVSRLRGHPDRRLGRARSVCDAAGAGRTGRPQSGIAGPGQGQGGRGNTITEVLQVMLLNNIKIKHEASLIVAMDWGKGMAVVQLPTGGLEAVQFDPRTLQIKS